MRIAGKEKGKLKVSFLRFKNVVIVNILEMPEEYRGIGTIIRHKEKNDEVWAIMSQHVPEFRYHNLYLRGIEKVMDRNCLSYTYLSSRDAIKAINIFSSMIRKLGGEAQKFVIAKAEFCVHFGREII